MGRACEIHWTEEKCIKGLVKKPKQKGDHLEYLGTDGRIILKCIFKIRNGRVWAGLTWMKTGTSV
jgi:hypothetical protein